MTHKTKIQAVRQGQSKQDYIIALLSGMFNLHRLNRKKEREGRGDRGCLKLRDYELRDLKYIYF